MSKKKLKFKKRRRLSRDELFPKRAERELDLLDYLITKSFPNPKEKEKYINDLIEGLEKEIQKGEQDVKETKTNGS